MVKNTNFRKKNFFCSFYVILSLNAKFYVHRSKGVVCGQYKDKEGKIALKMSIFTIEHVSKGADLFPYLIEDGT